MKYSLTPSQAALLAYIKGRIEKDGVAPSFDEMQRECDIASRGNAHRLVVALEERGHIQRMSGKSRAIRIID